MSKFRFGQPDQYEVGSIFDSRKALSDAGIHGPPMHGIWGCQRERRLNSFIVFSSEIYGEGYRFGH